MTHRDRHRPTSRTRHDRPLPSPSARTPPHSCRCHRMCCVDQRVEAWGQATQHGAWYDKWMNRRVCRPMLLRLCVLPLAAPADVGCARRTAAIVVSRSFTPLFVMCMQTTTRKVRVASPRPACGRPCSGPTHDGAHGWLRACRWNSMPCQHAAASGWRPASVSIDGSSSTCR